MRASGYFVLVLAALLSLYVSAFSTNHIGSSSSFVHRPTRAFKAPHTRTSTARTRPIRNHHHVLHMTLWSNTVDAIRTFSSSSALDSVTAQALATPPVIYFICLLSAGIGVPVSEDALCLFAGTAWSTFSPEKRIRLVLALYAGVVLSDVITFSIGRLLHTGKFAKLRTKFDDLLQEDDDNDNVDDAVATVPLRKRDRIRRVMRNSGDWVGFVIRFSVGTRGPLMLLTGFLGRVSFGKFLLGSCAGASITLPLQLWLGYTLGHNHPAAAVGLVGGISSVVLCITIGVAIVSWITLLLSKIKPAQQEQIE